MAEGFFKHALIFSFQIMAEGSSIVENDPIFSHLLNEYEKVY
jgi:hypothetical protein